MHLNETQLKTLEATMARIIPSDDTPGATEAETIKYVLTQFERDLFDKVASYRSGLDALDSEALKRCELPFHHLSTHDQDELLRDIESNMVQTNWPISPSEFFSMIVSHTAEGFYSDPSNGGNKNVLSWEVIGF